MLRTPEAGMTIYFECLLASCSAGLLRTHEPYLAPWTPAFAPSPYRSIAIYKMPGTVEKANRQLAALHCQGCVYCVRPVKRAKDTSVPCSFSNRSSRGTRVQTLMSMCRNPVCVTGYVFSRCAVRCISSGPTHHLKHADPRGKKPERAYQRRL